MEADLVVLFELACRSMGRRLRPGVSAERVVMLMIALSDGLVLRTTIEPSVISADEVGAAVYALAEAFTEDGGLATDPRRPIDADRAAVFDEAVDTALDLAKRGDLEITVEGVASSSTLERETVAFLFPTDDSLIDSAVRRLIPSDELQRAAASRYPVVILEVALATLAEAVDAHPGLFAAETPQVISDFTEAVADALAIGDATGTLHCKAADDTAKALVDFAMSGSASEKSRSAVLRAMAPPEPPGTLMKPLDPRRDDS
jgi:hypothetical protein